MNTNENLIRDLAYQIWESEGRPHGQSARHWEMACKLADETPGADNQLTAAAPKSGKATITSQGAGVANQQQAEAKPAKPVRKAKPKTTPQMS